MVEKSTAEESNPAVIGVLFLFFAPCSAIFGTLDTYSGLFGTWPWSCSGGIPVAGIFSPMETTFCPQSRCLVSPREAKDPRWIIFCSALLLFYPSTDPFFYFFSFSSPCLFYCHRVVCSVSSSLSLSTPGYFPLPPSCLRTPNRFARTANWPSWHRPAPVLAGSETVAAFYTPARYRFPSLVESNSVVVA